MKNKTKQKISCQKLQVKQSSTHGTKKDILRRGIRHGPSPPAPSRAPLLCRCQSTQPLVAAIHLAHICWLPIFQQAVHRALEDKMEKKT